MHPRLPPQTVALDEVSLPVMSEREYARGLAGTGYRVLRRRGRYWYRQLGGMYWAVNWTARMDDREARAPHPLAWGYRTSVAEGVPANGTLWLQMMPDITGYDLAALPSKRRNQLRKCWRQVELVALTGPELLLEQGHRVVTSAYRRTGYGAPVRPSSYHRTAPGEIGTLGRVHLAGLVHGRLAGYLVARAVERTAYIAAVHLDTELLPSNVGTGLVFEFVQICRRTPGIREIVYGPHSRYDEPLCRFKKGMGFPPVAIPARYRLNAAAAALIRRRRPDMYYYITGEPA